MAGDARDWARPQNGEHVSPKLAFDNFASALAPDVARDEVFSHGGDCVGAGSCDCVAWVLACFDFGQPVTRLVASGSQAELSDLSDFPAREMG